MRLLEMGFAVTCAGMMAGCKESSSAPRAVQDIVVSATNPVIGALGASTQLTAVARDAGGGSVPGQSFAWTSSAPTIATIDNTGLAKGLANGVTTITATASGKSGVFTLTVSQVPTTLTVSPATTTLDGVGKTATLTAAARDALGNPFTATPVWSSSNTAVATVSATGVVTAVGPGTALITATAGTVSATASFSVTVTRFAYAWADQSSSTTAYAPAARFAFNATGGAISITRPAVGRYVVTVGGLAKRTNSETVLVSAYGGAAPTRCVVEGWADSPNSRDLDVTVACVTPVGALTDSRFTILVVGNGVLPQRLGFALADNSSVASYAPSATYAHTSSGSAVTATRTAAGTYQLQLNVPRNTGDPPENYFISAYGTGTSHCKTPTWNFGTSVDVRCYTNAGALTDSRYAALLVSGGRPGTRFAFGRNQTATPVGSVDAVGTYGRNSSGGSLLISKLATGTYNVVATGLATPTGKTETVVVTASGPTVSYCRVLTWLNQGADILAQVGCSDANGNAVDSQFTILIIE